MHAMNDVKVCLAC